MRINADFAKPAAVNVSAADWIPSPAAGVERIMLDRIGDEVARATSVVRYAAGSRFARHEHAKGEEFLVLEGVFSDESGHYPAGTYVRNPPGSGHAPFSDEGCRILVKLRQFDPEDLAPVVIDTHDGALWQEDGLNARLALHAFGTERVAMLRIGAGGDCMLEGDPGGTEILLVSGVLMIDGSTHSAETWLRYPPGQAPTLRARVETVLWIKQGHLPAG